jgi:hypothetical protein
MAAKKNNIFVKAKAYQKLHPKTDWATCIQKCKGKCVTGTHKKIASPAVAKVGKVRKRTSTGTVKRIAVPGKKTSSLQKGRVLVNRIKTLETKRKMEKARELKDLIQIEINACHDRLDSLKKQGRKKSA